MPAVPSPISEYQRVIDTIEERIRTGRYRPGDKLPSIAELAAELGVSQTTIKNAQLILRHSGQIYGRHGKGVYVTESSPGGG